MAKAVSYEKVYGLSAVRALHARRPQDVRRIAYTKEVRRDIGDLLRDAAARRIAYEERPEEELSKIAGAVHHEGICISANPRTVFGIEAMLDHFQRRTWRSAIALDDVGNPHNIGAIARTAAFFGVDALVLASAGHRSPLVPAAVRIAQGGAEYVSVVQVADLAEALTTLGSARIPVIGSAVRDAMPLWEVRWPERFVVVLGSEGHGMTDRVREACGARLLIPGGGAIESLNVSVAAGVILSAWSAR